MSQKNYLMSDSYCACPCGSFDTQIVIVHDIISYATHVLTCHKMSYNEKSGMLYHVKKYCKRGIENPAR